MAATHAFFGLEKQAQGTKEVEGTSSAPRGKMMESNLLKLPFCKAGLTRHMSSQHAHICKNSSCQGVKRINISYRFSPV